MTAPHPIPAAAQVEDWHAARFPNQPLTEPSRVTLDVWNIADFRELVRAEAGPPIADTFASLFGIPLHQDLSLRPGMATALFDFQAFEEFDFTDNLRATGQFRTARQ